MKRFIGIIGVIILWEFAAWKIGSPMFPPISKVLPALGKLFSTGDIFPHIQASMINIIIGFGLASIFGFFIAIIISQFKTVDLIVMPIVDLMRPIAALTLFPLIILVLGIGMESKIFIIFWTSWPAVVLNTVQGIRTVDRSIVEAAQLDGAGRFHSLLHVILPLASATITTGLRIGLSGGYISLVASEMLGSNKGLGYAILIYSQTFRFPEMYSIVITIAALGLLMNIGLAWIQSKYTYQEAKDETSKFIRYGDRASGFGFDSIRLRRKNNHARRIDANPLC